MVICPDICGYGQSFKPACSSDHAAYSKMAMAQDMIEMMDQLGHNKFYLAGHDRGARVAHRLAIDYPHRVYKMALLDIVPTLEHFERVDIDFALGYYHWFWLAQPHPFPEILINKAPEDWFYTHTSREPKTAAFFHPDALVDYLKSIRNPEMIRGMCEDYRAAASIDLVHDKLSRKMGAKINCPLLTIWGKNGKIGKWYNSTEIWSDYCNSSVEGIELNSGHYIAEEEPQELILHFQSFFKSTY